MRHVSSESRRGFAITDVLVTKSTAPLFPPTFKSAQDRHEYISYNLCNLSRGTRVRTMPRIQLHDLDLLVPGLFLQHLDLILLKICGEHLISVTGDECTRNGPVKRGEFRGRSHETVDCVNGTSAGVANCFPLRQIGENARCCFGDDVSHVMLYEGTQCWVSTKLTSRLVHAYLVNNFKVVIWNMRKRINSCLSRFADDWTEIDYVDHTP